MPAPTVTLVASSIRIRLPVERLRQYRSNASGVVVRIVILATSLGPTVKSSSILSIVLMSIL